MKPALHQSILFLLALGLVLAGCAKKEEAPPPAPVASQPAEATAAETRVTSSQLEPALVGRLTRPYSPVLGSANAPVTVVEFLDPACEACRAFSPLVKQILFMHSEDVRVVIRYAAFHQGSDEAIRILEAARRQGRVDEVLGALFDQQQEWASHHTPNVDRAWQIAGAAGLDLSRARRDARTPEADALLAQENEDIVALQVTRTPTFFVNGKLLTDFGPEQLMNLVAAEVEAAKKSP